MASGGGQTADRINADRMALRGLLEGLAPMLFGW